MCSAIRYNYTERVVGCMAPSSSAPTVLVVDDEQAVADAYALQIESEYETRVAYGGKEALEKIDESVAIVLLDRRMPDLSGDEVLAEIRERELGCRVVMVTAVDPDFDIVDMPFDSYLKKPVKRAELLGEIERQLSVDSYDDQFDEFLELSTKLELLREEKPAQELQSDDDVQAMESRVGELKSQLDETVADFDDPAQAFSDLV